MGPGGPLRYAATPVSRAARIAAAAPAAPPAAAPAASPAASSATRARRLAAAAAAALIGAGVLASCTGATSYAVVVNGTTISASTLLHDLDALGSNAGFVTAYDSGVTQATSQGQSDLYPVF